MDGEIISTVTTGMASLPLVSREVVASCCMKMARTIFTVIVRRPLLCDEVAAAPRCGPCGVRARRSRRRVREGEAQRGEEH